MKLTIQIHLLPNAQQKRILLETMERFNAAASLAAEVGFADRVHSLPSIQKRCYYRIREEFGLSAQMAVRAIGKAAETFQRDKSRCPRFKPRGAVTYDERILSFKGLDQVSIWTVAGRQRIPMVFGGYQSERMRYLKGQVDLVYRDGQFCLYATIDLPENPPIEISEFVGIDLGIVSIATDSDGNTYSGVQVEKVRKRHALTRQRLQRKGTRGAKKILKRIRRRESRFRRHENHVISKRIVASAKDTGRGIALENLKGIRGRTTVRQKQRARHYGWSFFQLRSFIEYKSKLAGIPVVAIDPKYTSQTCSVCGHRHKNNRKSQSEFECRACHFRSNADFNAARNVRAWAVYSPASELTGQKV